MKDYSLFQGWKELHGTLGIVSFEDRGCQWGVYHHREGKERVYVGSIAKMSGKESNEALYERGTDLVFPTLTEDE